jgi:hypothetical protein
LIFELGFPRVPYETKRSTTAPGHTGPVYCFIIIITVSYMIFLCV